MPSHRLHFTFFRVLLLLGTLLFAPQIYSEPPSDSRGPEFVKREMPLFYNAWVAAAGEKAAHEFFADWTGLEKEFLDEKFRSISRVTSASLKSVRATDDLFDSYGGTIFGTSGEVYGNVLLRRIAAEKGALSLDEEEYKRHNPEGNKPDGLLFQIEGKKLVVLSVLESKLGQQSWSNGQIDGFLERWQKHGITIPHNGGTKYFPPNEIFFESEGQRIALEKVDNTLVKRTGILVGTRGSVEFPGQYVQLPVDATLIREAAYRYLDQLRNHRAAPQGNRDRPAPVLEGQPLEDYRQALKDFIFDRRQWPKSDLGPLAAEIRRHMSRRGGQSRAFIYDMDGATRHYMATAGQLPAIGTFEQHLLEASPADPNVISALRTYLNYYEKGTGEESPFAKKLASVSPDWAHFFSKRSISSIRDYDVEEMELCSIYLSKMGKK